MCLDLAIPTQFVACFKSLWIAHLNYARRSSINSTCNVTHRKRLKFRVCPKTVFYGSGYCRDPVLSSLRMWELLQFYYELRWL